MELDKAKLFVIDTVGEKADDFLLNREKADDFLLNLEKSDDFPLNQDFTKISSQTMAADLLGQEKREVSGRLGQKNGVSKSLDVKKPKRRHRSRRRTLRLRYDDLSLSQEEILRRIRNLDDKKIIDLLISFGCFGRTRARYFTSHLFDGFYLGAVGRVSSCQNINESGDRCRGNHPSSFCPCLL